MTTGTAQSVFDVLAHATPIGPSSGDHLLTPDERRVLLQFEDLVHRGRLSYYEVGRALIAIRDGRLYREGYRSIGEFCVERLAICQSRCYQLMTAVGVADQLGATIGVRPTKEAHVRLLLPYALVDQIAIWREVVARSAGTKVTGTLIRGVIREITAGHCSLAIRFVQAEHRMSCADWTWNPVTGCLRGCDYCAARQLAGDCPETAGHGFVPAFHPERLSAPRHMGEPTTRSTAGGRVLVSPLGDILGDWVPDEWVNAVVETMREAPAWTFLVQTKNPARLTTITWPENVWVGATVDRQVRVIPTLEAFCAVLATVKYIACTPLLELVTMPSFTGVDWLHISEQYAAGIVPDRQPAWRWVASLLGQAEEAGCPVSCSWGLHVWPMQGPMTGCGGYVKGAMNR